MATGTDRYAPLREATPEVPDQMREPAPTQAVEDSLPVQQSQSPGWTDKGGMVEQQQSAMEWVKASNERRQSPQQEADRDAPVPQQSEEKRSLSFYEDKEQGRDYGELKTEHAENAGKEQDDGKAKQQDGSRSLAFYEDQNHDQGLTR